MRPFGSSSCPKRSRGFSSAAARLACSLAPFRRPRSRRRSAVGSTTSRESSVRSPVARRGAWAIARARPSSTLRPLRARQHRGQPATSIFDEPSVDLRRLSGPFRRFWVRLLAFQAPLYGSFRLIVGGLARRPGGGGQGWRRGGRAHPITHARARDWSERIRVLSRHLRAFRSGVPLWGDTYTDTRFAFRFPEHSGTVGGKPERSAHHCSPFGSAASSLALGFFALLPLLSSAGGRAAMTRGRFETSTASSTSAATSEPSR